MGAPVADIVDELPYPDLVALCEDVALRLGDPYVGLSIASALEPGAYGVFEYVAASAATVGDAVELLVEFQPLASELAQTRVVRDGDRIAFEHWIDHPSASASPQHNEFTLAAYLRLGWLRLGFRPRFLEVHFMHDRQERRARLEETFQAPIVFGAPRNALVMNAALLARPMVLADPRLFEILRERAEQDLQRMQLLTTVAGSLSAIYRELLVSAPHQANADEAARRMHTSVRSLHRRLAEEGTSFREVESGVKRVLANEYLRDSTQSVDRVAMLLGFANASAFIRAYKRWTGNTPHQSRQPR
jgi:AraC-like DNA-binding protein